MKHWFSRFYSSGSSLSDSSVSRRGSQGFRMDVHRRPLSMHRREVGDWSAARALRLHPTRTRTYALQEVYTDALLDAHLSGIVNNRVLKIQNRHFVVKDRGQRVSLEKSRLLEKSWFRHLLGYVMESLFFGYSLIWLKGFHKGGHLSCVELVDRGHVIPEQGQVVQDVREGKRHVLYGSYPHHLLYAQLGTDAVGLLEKATPLVYLKRHSWSNWDEFEQIFGMPLRVARVPNVESEEVAQIEHWLANMGSASYAILPSAAEIEIKDNQASDAHEVFQEKIKLVNSELSKLILGQTMSVDSGSSRSQSEVHERTEQHITRSDTEKVLHWLNDVLLPALRFHGYPFDEGDVIALRDEQNMAERIGIDKVLLQAGIKLSREYIESTYKVRTASDGFGSLVLKESSSAG